MFLPIGLGMLTISMQIYLVSLEWWLFSLVRGIWENFPQFISPPGLFLLFFFKVEISMRTLIPLFTPGSVHSGSAS